MSNAIPLLEGTDASGGYLVPDGQAGIVFERGLNRQSAVAGMPGLRIRRVNGKREKLTEYVGRPARSRPSRKAPPKPATGAEYAQVTLDMVKGAAIVMYTQELIEDAVEDPTILINNDVRAAFADWVDSNALGRTSSGTIVGSFNSELSETSRRSSSAPTGDALAVAVSSAMATIEANGYNPTGAILASDGRANLRNARTTGDASIPLYTGGVAGGFVNPDPVLYGIPLRFTTNLQTFAGNAASGRVVGVVGDFSQAVLGIRQDITVDFSNQATIDVGGTLHNLWQQNKVASRWEARMGFVAHDLNRAFVAIINAA
jgi:HK97 family phage major capsid protein